MEVPSSSDDEEYDGSSKSSGGCIKTLLCIGAAVGLAVGGVWALIEFNSQPDDTGSQDAAGDHRAMDVEHPDSAVRLGPPWWLVHNIAPAGPERDMGTWTAVTFSEEQQQHFGVDANGTVLDAARFDRAVSAQKKVPPWWILNGVKPAGPGKDFGSWTAVTFSEDQQKQFGVDADGRVVDRDQFDVGLSALKDQRLAALPPWWVLMNVKPAGEEKDMGGWTSATFSKQQQEMYGVDEKGEVVDQIIFYAAFPSLSKKMDRNQAHVGVMPPWWLVDGVKPAGEPRDMGTWTAVTFSEEQQDRFGVDQDGVVTDAEKFAAARAALRGPGEPTAEGEEGAGGAEDGCGGGPPKDMGCTLMVSFKPETPIIKIQMLEAKYRPSAHGASMLRSFKLLMLHYADDTERCCATYKELWEVPSVTAVEYDQLVSVAGPSGSAGGGMMTMR